MMGLLIACRLTIQDMIIVLDHGKNNKNAGKLTSRLREAGLISVFIRQEIREGAMKAMSREYFYIDYRKAIDSTKYRIHMMDEKIKQTAKPSQERKEYNCPRCKAQWTTMEVLDKVDLYHRASGFLCLQCDHPLDTIAPDDAPENDDTPAMFNKQFGPLLKLMQTIDTVTIPAIEGKDAVEGAIELPRDQILNPAAKHEAVPETTLRPTAVKGVATAPEKIEVSIATQSEYTEAARTAEAARKARIEAQNQLPEWHTKSTVVKSESTSVSTVAGKIKVDDGADAPAIKNEAVEDKKDKDPELDAVFAALAAQRQKEQDEDDEDDEDEDEDEFEDVPVSNVIPEAKRIKVEASAAPSPMNGGGTPAATSTGDGGDESDEDEFVDV
ncbi:hypothetical protein P154DRAFT_525096 [Amniculicola lignicola CBS 123094]|uniref:TFIIEalpha/SarR/Rpc3 HTH domain-containing protein n=1 Tax=Amniculicola lignicola CBS 123094 TaxID=1392246 RepID=A0A6A5W6Z3_9PLEO|nr:hypothetical protein P154DRAFT_525096 [Amniculicola lignicola CBS 123094]